MRASASPARTIAPDFGKEMLIETATANLARAVLDRAIAPEYALELIERLLAHADELADGTFRGVRPVLRSA